MKRLIFSCCCFLILFSCKNESKSIEIPTDFSVKNLVEIMKKPTSISKEKLAEITGTSVDKIKIYNENFSPDFSKRMVLFSWPNGETKSVKTQSGKKLKIEAYNSIGMGLVKRISKEEFQNQFESGEFIQNEINRITKDETIQAEIAIAEAKFLAENAKIQEFEKLENIGQLAYWEKPVNALHVFAENVSFTITTNLPDEKLSKNKAIQMVELIFEKP